MIFAVTTYVHCALLNFERGGLSQPADTDLICHRGHWDFTGLRATFSVLTTAPDVIAINEAKEWGLWGGKALRFAARVLSELFDRPYVGEIGWLPRGKSGPALFYDASRLHLGVWGDDDPTVHDDKRNYGLLYLRGYTDSGFAVLLDHWPYWSGDARVDRARFLSDLGRSATRTLWVGDFNGTASGRHWPVRDWSVVHPGEATGKGTRLPDGTFTVNTDALDHLLGRYDEERGVRFGGSGFHAIPELAWMQGMPREKALIPTVNDGVDAGGGLLIDMGLLNDAWKHGLVRDSFRIHVPAGRRREDYDSDHRISEWTLDCRSAAG
jgi:hypothetical protein